MIYTQHTLCPCCNKKIKPTNHGTDQTIIYCDNTNCAWIGKRWKAIKRIPIDY